MHPIVEKKKKKRNERAEKKEKTHHHLRAVDEDANDGGDGNTSNNDANGDDGNRLEAKKPLLTQENVVQMFESELDEYAALNRYSYDDDSSTDRQRKHPSRTVQYVVENEISGDFFRVRGATTRSRSRNLQLLSRASSRFPHLRTKLDGDRSFWSHAEMLRDLETAVIVMCQGILAGLCWMDAFNLSSGDGVIRSATKEVFVCTYSAVADRSRQLFFILFKYPFSLR